MRIWEKWLLTHSAAVIVATQGLKKDLESFWPALTNHPPFVVWNGFWKPDYEALDLSASHPVSDQVHLIHTGNFYGSRNPLPFIKALLWLKRHNPECLNRLHFTFMGQFESEQAKRHFITEVKGAGLGDLFTLLPLSPRKLALEAIAASDLAIIITHSSGSENAVPAKLYEYLALGKRVLAISHDSFVKSIIEDANIGWCVPHDNIDELGQVLSIIASNAEMPHSFDPHIIAKFDARYQLEKLESRLSQLLR